MTPEDRALCVRVAREVMGYTDVQTTDGMIVGTDHHGIQRRCDPLHDDRDFGALLDKCAERWEVALVMVRQRAPASWRCEIIQQNVPIGVADTPDRRRALVLASLAAVEAERNEEMT